MIIDKMTYICPKCKQTFDNFDLRSFSSPMADAANNFVKNNKPTTDCPKCKVRLVRENLIKYFNSKGHFDFDTETLTWPTEGEFEFFCTLNIKLREIQNCLDFKTLDLVGIVDKVKKEDLPKDKVAKGLVDTHEAVSHILINVVHEGKGYTLFDIMIAKANYANIGDRYNSFCVEYYTHINKAVLNILKSALGTDLKIKVKTTSEVKFKDNIKTYHN